MRVVVGFSGGPDAAALAYRLRQTGAEVIPVYVNYRKTLGGKSARDMYAVRVVAALLDIPRPIEVRAPLGARPKGQRNRFFVEVLAKIAKKHDADAIALGTIKNDGGREELGRAMRNDLDPVVLTKHSNRVGVRVITWDTFGVITKADEFAGMSDCARNAILHTTSCQMWWKLECGNCGSCARRHQAFLSAFGEDPTRYRPNSRIGRETRKH